MFYNFSPTTRNFVTYVNQGSVLRDLVTTVTVARVLAVRAGLPQEGDNTNDFYTNVVRANVQSTMSKLYALMPYDIDGVDLYLRAFYKSRVAAAYPPKKIMVRSRENFVTQVLGTSGELPDNLIKVLNDNQDKHCELYNRFQDLLDELEKGE